MIEFAKTHELSVFLQSGGPETIEGLWPFDPPRLGYELSKFDLYFEFEPLEFTQVNQETNAHLVDCVVDWLAPTAKDRILDLFCGLGNFPLPIGCGGANVVGLEGSDNLVAKARAEGDAMIKRARESIEREKDAALEDLRKESVELALAAAAKLVQESLDEEKDRELVMSFIDELSGGGGVQA